MALSRCSALASLLGLLAIVTVPLPALGAGRKLFAGGFNENCGDDWQQTLDLHNAYRAQHQAPPLKWHKGLQANALYWAKQLAAKGCKLDHSGPGENLYANYGYKENGNCVDATKLWFAEEKFYSFKVSPLSNPFMKTGHFTQIIWKDTQFVGCASATNGRCVVVDCQYLQWGNNQSNDAYEANVMPSKGAKVDVEAVLGGTSTSDPPSPRSAKTPREPPSAPSPRSPREPRQPRSPR